MEKKTNANTRHCERGIVIASVALSLRAWLCHCERGIVIASVGLSLRAWLCHCERGFVIASVALSLRAKRSNLVLVTIRSEAISFWWQYNGIASSPLRGSSQ